MSREPLVSIVMWGSVVFSVLTLFAAAKLRPLSGKTGGAKTFGYLLLAFWAIAPPVWFFFEWVYLVDHKLPEEVARISHSHDLGRNVWIAYIAVLASMLGVKWPLEK
jgi:hypothetical protein